MGLRIYTYLLPFKNNRGWFVNPIKVNEPVKSIITLLCTNNTALTSPTNTNAKYLLASFLNNYHSLFPFTSLVNALAFSFAKAIL